MAPPGGSNLGPFDPKSDNLTTTPPQKKPVTKLSKAMDRNNWPASVSRKHKVYIIVIAIFLDSLLTYRLYTHHTMIYVRHQSQCCGL